MDMNHVVITVMSHVIRSRFPDGRPLYKIK